MNLTFAGQVAVQQNDGDILRPSREGQGTYTAGQWFPRLFEKEPRCRSPLFSGTQGEGNFTRQDELLTDVTITRHGEMGNPNASIDRRRDCRGGKLL